MLHNSGVEMDDLVLRLVASPTGLNCTDRDGFRGSGSRSRGVRSGRGEGSVGDVDAIACLDAESQGNDFGDMGFGAIYLDRDTKRLAQQAHGLETFLVVGATATDVDFDLMINEGCLELLKSTDDTLEGGGNIGKVCNTTTNDQDLSLGVGLPTSHKVKDSFGVLVGLTLGWSSGVLSIVGELMGETVGGNGI